MELLPDVLLGAVGKLYAGDVDGEGVGAQQTQRFWGHGSYLYLSQVSAPVPYRHSAAWCHAGTALRNVGASSHMTSSSVDVQVQALPCEIARTNASPPSPREVVRRKVMQRG